MKKILILIISLFFNFNYVYSADYKIGNKLKMVSADGFTKANTGEKIYSKDNTLKIEGDWSERFVLGVIVNLIDQGQNKKKITAKQETSGTDLVFLFLKTTHQKQEV